MMLIHAVHGDAVPAGFNEGRHETSLPILDDEARRRQNPKSRSRIVTAVTTQLRH